MIVSNDVSTQSRQHFKILDGLRGVAAIAIVVFHFAEWIYVDVAQNFKPIKTLDVITEGVADGGHGGPNLVVNPNSADVYVLNTAKKQIAVIDPKAATLKPTIDLAFTPSELTWFGAIKNK